MTADTLSSLGVRLQRIYGTPQPELERRLAALISRFPQDTTERGTSTNIPSEPFSERDVVLITYGDQIRSADRSSLATLHEFLNTENLRDCLNTVHLLPFFPYTSDDGFSVVDYLQVDPELGDWSDIERLGRDFHLMFDLVLNHVSQEHAWFKEYLKGNAPFDRFFLDVNPQTDLSLVTRPRSHPLLTPFETADGTKHVWTTFSADQVDINYGEPELLLRMLQVLLEYIRRGAKIIRLDAIAYLWKEVGTNCIHLHQTHEVVKLMRDLVDAVAPHVLLLTETNVPHRENVSYFGAGDEAHMVYQFSLPPLLLDAFLNADGTVFSEWLADLQPPPAGATYFNFTASHDGIGVRPLEGLVAGERLERLADFAREHGGLVSMRTMPDGSQRPYELNITYVDALSPPGSYNARLHARRFLTSQGLMLAMAGMPAVYFHSLVGTQNDSEGVEQTGQARRINRRKFAREELNERLSRPGSLQETIYRGYRRLLNCRIGQPAFHPAAPQGIVNLGDPQIIAFLRESRDGGQRVLAVANLSAEEKVLDLSSTPLRNPAKDLLATAALLDGGRISLPPYELAWLTS